MYRAIGVIQNRKDLDFDRIVTGPTKGKKSVFIFIIKLAIK